MRPRVAASAALAALLAATLAGCNLLTPQATLKEYDASDGVSGHVGDVKVLNVVAIAGDTRRTDTDANLVFTAVNASDDSVRLHVQYQVGGKTRDRSVEVAPGSTKVGSGKHGQLLLTGFRPRPGALASIYFQYADHQGEQLRVPVLDDSWSTYSDLGPTPTPTRTPTPTPSASLPSGTPSPTPSASTGSNG